MQEPNLAVLPSSYKICFCKQSKSPTTQINFKLYNAIRYNSMRNSKQIKNEKEKVRLIFDRLLKCTQFVNKNIEPITTFQSRNLLSH